jgi:hypothetical protein
VPGAGQRRADRAGCGVAVTVRAVLHPVGPLPAAVYWRRRALVLTLLLAVLGGGGWLGYAATTGGADWPTFTEAAPTSSAPPIGTPALEQVVPSLASVRIPTPAATTPRAGVQPVNPPAGSPEGPVPCTDDVLRAEVHVPGPVPARGKPTFELRVTNSAATPCVRALDKGLQELVILDGTGKRLWGSNDCFPEASRDLRTLGPGEIVTFPVVWSGLTSEPGCAGTRVPLLPGYYVVRGRLDTETAPDVPLVVT